jgi:6-phospho-3-hexuloisomerase
MSRFSEQDALEDLAHVLERVTPDEVAAYETAILSSQRIFVTGLGRTGLMARGFAMRLMHLGRRVYHVGDVITPSIQAGDLLIICSRTGRSQVLLHYIEIARRSGGSVAVVTADAESPVAQSADVILSIDDRPALARRAVHAQPLGSLFEQALLIVLDQVVLSLMEALDLTEAEMARIHTTFE